MQQAEPIRATPVEPSAKAARTRAAILAAAEQQFARYGFVATRLEDVAEAVDLKRAALFYHFRDKQSLYDAVVADAFGALTVRIEQAFAANDPISKRIEHAVEAWIDTVVARPTLARLILRHAAEADEHGRQAMFPGVERLVGQAWSLFQEGTKNGELEPAVDDAFHAASTVIGGTVFYVTALAPLIPSASFKPLSQEQVAGHKRYTLRTVRLLLGIAEPAPAKKKRAPRQTTRKTKRAG